MKTIDEIWVEFKEAVLLQDVSKIQEREMKMAFFAGVKSTLSEFGEISGSAEAKDDVVAALIAMDEQLNCFFEQYIS